MKRIPHHVDLLSKKIAVATKPFIESKAGKIFQSFVLLGPATFIPTIYTAWTSPNIDSLKTLTWPLMIIVNISALFSLIHNGNWRMRLASFAWIIVVTIVYIATLIR